MATERARIRPPGTAVRRSVAWRRGDVEARVNLARRRYTRASATRARRRPGSAAAAEAECCCLGFLMFRKVWG
ncbi:hypothetical protein ES332_D09G264500v1 [Gossypium tomentosum]|uniref:Uncharacterized protein n=1 Tax=Gossypium tomentosum TaxID=34277 RepID=A0A5D2JMV0_GOSTO|nr:hypothetical protein ES332_D09G264500v1 [Gossypium tomentosum]